MADREQPRLELPELQLHHQNLRQAIHTLQTVLATARRLAILNKTRLPELMGLVDTVSNFPKQNHTK